MAVHEITVFDKVCPILARIYSLQVNVTMNRLASATMEICINANILCGKSGH